MSRLRYIYVILLCPFFVSNFHLYYYYARYFDFCESVAVVSYVTTTRRYFRAFAPWMRCDLTGGINTAGRVLFAAVKKKGLHARGCLSPRLVIVVTWSERMMRQRCSLRVVNNARYTVLLLACAVTAGCIPFVTIIHRREHLYASRCTRGVSFSSSHGYVSCSFYTSRNR